MQDVLSNCQYWLKYVACVNGPKSIRSSFPIVKFNFVCGPQKMRLQKRFFFLFRSGNFDVAFKKDFIFLIHLKWQKNLSWVVKLSLYFLLKRRTYFWSALWWKQAFPFEKTFEFGGMHRLSILMCPHILLSFEHLKESIYRLGLMWLKEVPAGYSEGLWQLTVAQIIDNRKSAIWGGRTFVRPLFVGPAVETRISGAVPASAGFIQKQLATCPKIFLLQCVASKSQT